ncbi:rhodanese-like domain-containing protein [Shivajiella indica]|uniref:Rhodanese-like domain-containing protein n=1 Tax=Shivajiella indica TaxID=872115 RepID=A0ABW5B842_9BACT
MSFKHAFIFFWVPFLFFGCSQNKIENHKTKDPSNSESFIKNVDAATFKNLVDSGQGIVLDVRTIGEVAQGHIPNAHVADIYQRDFMEKIQQLPRDKEVYVYCTVGARSSQAAKILLDNGFKKVYNLKGGIIDWTRNGYPIEK